MPASSLGFSGTCGRRFTCTLLSAGGFLLSSLIPSLAFADVVTDGTLGDGSSPLGPDFEITEAMGERPGGGPNLFHSFFEFNLDETQSATFGGPDAVENILGRVTGGTRSEIFGAVRTAPSLGEVDLYLMNPSGMVFGESATLDVNGSFHATTADYIGLGGGGERFYADPSRTSLLSAAPPSAFGFLGGGAADDGLAAITVEDATLEVPSGESLSLIARDVGSGGIEISGATLRAEGGRIDLVSVGSAGEVRLGESGSSEPPELTEFEALGSLDIVSGSPVDVSGDLPGSVWIRGGRLVVEDSEVRAVHQGANPGSGRISIAADESVLVWEGALIDAGTVASGDGGEIDVTAPELIIDNGKITSPSTYPSLPPRIADGAAGTIRLDVGALVIRNGDGTPLTLAEAMTALPVGISAETRGSGAGGTILIAADSVELSGGAGVSANTVGPWATKPDVEPDGPDAASEDANAGRIEIVAESLIIRDEAFVYAETSYGSEGNAGEVVLDVGTLRIDGTPGKDGYEAVLSAASYYGAGTSGIGGSIDITAESIEVVDGASIMAGSIGGASGKAGTISIHADSVLVQGAEFLPAFGFVHSSLITAGTEGAGDAGIIGIEAGSLQIEDGGAIYAGTSGPGNAGIIAIEAGSVELRDGGYISASAGFGSMGDAGTITVEASDSVFISHAGGDRLSLSDIIGGGAAPTGIYSATVRGGDSGSITVSAPEITVTEGGIIGTSTLGGGDAGDVILRGERITISSGGFVDSTSVPVEELPGGEAGSVTLEATESITVEGRSAFGDQSRVTSITLGPSDAGSVSLRAPRILVNDGVIATLSAEIGAGLQETSDLFAFLDDEGLSAAPPSVATGNAGSVTLEADQVLVYGGSIAAYSELADGGDVTILATEMLHLIDGEITASVSSGSGGNIVIDPVFVILEGESRIVAQAIEGSGGNISITTDALLASQESVISASSQLGVQGTVEIHSPETDVAGTLASLPETFLEAAALMRERCAARKGGESAGSFVWTGRQGVSWSPDGMIPASYREAEERPEAMGLVLGTSPATGERVALLVGCGGGEAVTSGRRTAEALVHAR